MLGRADGATPYTTTVQTFNGRGQVTRTRQYAGSDTSTEYQDVLMTYDGHGRLKTRHYPIEDAQTETTWNYNADDTVSQVIDPRGAITDMTYDTRGLTTQVAYTPPSVGNVPDTPTTVFTYDNAGNRTSMDTAGVSATAYSYDELSRITAETVDFDDLTSNYSIAYGYELSGQLKTVTDPFGDAVSYNNDEAGRTTSITGTSFGGVTTYAENIKFRAFGGLKEMEYGSDDNSVISYGYDDRLRIESYQATSSVQTSGYVRKAEYDYNADATVLSVDNMLNDGFDQTYKYDHIGRLKATTSGMVTSSVNGQVEAYKQTIGYDAFGNMSSRNAHTWGDHNSFTATYVNHRKTNGNEVFDAAGNIIEKPTVSWENNEKWIFDASGRAFEQKSISRVPLFRITHTGTQYRDGDGNKVKYREVRLVEQLSPTTGSSTREDIEYYVRSSVLGGAVLTELKENGDKMATKVYAGNTVVAEQRNDLGESVVWQHKDPLTQSFSMTVKSGAMFDPDDAEFNAEFEPLGAVLPQEDPAENIDSDPMPTRYRKRGGGDPFNPEHGCMHNGAPVANCSEIAILLHIFGVTTIGGAVIQVDRYTEDNHVTVGCPDDDPNCEPVPADPSEPTVTYNVNLTFISDKYDCWNAIYSVVPKKYLDYAKIAVPALDFATSGIGYSWQQFAYLLATAEHESRFGAPSHLSFSVPMEEDWNVNDPTSDQKSYETNQSIGNTQRGDGYLFRGRGYVQITGRGNYARLSKEFPLAFGKPFLEENPDMATIPNIAATIAARGLQNDLFTQRGRKINDVIKSGTFNEFLNARSFIGSRYVQEGNVLADVGTRIANNAVAYFEAMKGVCF